MHRLVKHHTIEELNAAARKAKKERVATRILMIRDVQSGMLRRSVCEHYGASSATLSLWVQRYNAAGLAGLEDKPRPGAPCKKLEVKQQATFRERLIKQPDAGKDGLVRWRVRDVQKVLQEEFRLPVTVNKG